MAGALNRNARSRDDELFTKVLSSAYSLQQQHDRIQSRLPAARFSEILAEVINTQTLIRSRKLDSETALHLIASRTEKLSGAAGAAIAFVDGDMLEYRIGTGIAAILCGFKSRAQEIVSFERLKSDSLAETDTWQEKVLSGRVVANVLSAPIYRQGSLAGCIQLFSRHGHFDLDGRYVCELMSGIVSQVVETIPLSSAPPREERPANVPVDGASLRDHQDTSDPATHATRNRAKLEWPGTNTRELEARLKKAAMSANAVDKAPKAVAAGESIRFSPPVARTSRQEPDGVSRQEKSIIRDKQDGMDRNPQISRGGQGPSPSHSSLALVPPETHAPRLVPNPPAVDDKTVTDNTWDDDREDGREPQRDASRVALVQESIPAARSSHTADPKEDRAESMTWKRISRMIYPIFVLLFAVGVRIRAGAHNWPLEVIIYILLVLTTLELQSRWSKR
jgi:hypothetical protein